MRNRILIAGGSLLLLALTACRDDMHDQPRYKPLAASEFFSDHRSARPEVEGTIARGQLRIDEARYTGKINGEEIDQFPIPITKEDIERGQTRFNVYCTPCHSRLGDGNGMVAMRGMKHPPSYHQPRLRQVPNGYLFDVVTNGFGQMLGYSAQISRRDTWAIIAYIRALQFSRNAPVSELPADMRKKLEEGGESK